MLDIYFTKEGKRFITVATSKGKRRVKNDHAEGGWNHWNAVEAVLEEGTAIHTGQSVAAHTNGRWEKAFIIGKKQQ